MPLKNSRRCWYNDTSFEHYAVGRLQECLTFKNYFYSTNASIMDVNTVDITHGLNASNLDYR